MSRSKTYVLLIGLFALALSVPAQQSEQSAPPDRERAEQVELALSGTEVLIFKAEWCEPCQRMAHVPDQLRERGVKVRVVDIDLYPEVARYYGIEAIPTTIVLQDGEIVQQEAGVVDVVLILRIIARVLKHIVPWLLEFWGL